MIKVSVQRKDTDSTGHSGLPKTGSPVRLSRRPNPNAKVPYKNVLRRFPHTVRSTKRFVFRGAVSVTAAETGTVTRFRRGNGDEDSPHLEATDVPIDSSNGGVLINKLFTRMADGTNRINSIGPANKTFQSFSLVVHQRRQELQSSVYADCFLSEAAPSPFRANRQRVNQTVHTIWKRAIAGTKIQDSTDGDSSYEGFSDHNKAIGRPPQLNRDVFANGSTANFILNRQEIIVDVAALRYSTRRENWIMRLSDDNTPCSRGISIMHPNKFSRLAWTRFPRLSPNEMSNQFRRPVNDESCGAKNALAAHTFNGIK